MKSIHFSDRLDMKELFKQYGLKDDMFVNIKIGYDGRIYILFSAAIPERIDGMFVNTCANADYTALVLTVDWNEGNLLQCEKLELGHHEINFHFIQPIGENVLLLGSRCLYNESDEPENNAVIVDKHGNVVKKFCLGDGIEDCIVTESGDIITSYFDEGVFGNFGWYEPIGACGLIVWSPDKKIKWQANRSIYDCYAINLDDRGNLWYYYYDDFLLVKTDLKTETEYKPDINGASGFMVTYDMGHLLIDGGYDKHWEFRVARFKEDTLGNYENVSLLYNDSDIVVKFFRFRGSKAVFVDNKDRLYIKEIFSLY